MHSMTPSIPMALAEAAEAAWNRADPSIFERFDAGAARVAAAPDAAKPRLLFELCLPLADIAARTDDDTVLLGLLARGFRRHAPARTMLDHMIAVARYAALGRPTIHVSGRLAGALMLSDLAADQLGGLRLPWRAFELRLGEPLDVDGAPLGSVIVRRWQTQFDPAALPFPSYADGAWSLFADPRGNATCQHAPGPIELYAPLEIPEVECDLHRPLSPAQVRALGLLSRLVLHVCAALQAHGPSALRPRTRRRKGDKRRPVIAAGGALERELVLPVSVDVRAHIADYLSGDVARVYKVRWVVRGHWRNQPYGPERALRRLTWIEPHWKGPEGAPAATD